MSAVNDIVESPDLIHFIWARRKQLRGALFLACMRSIVLAPTPIFFQIIVDEFVNTGNIHGIGAISLMFIGIMGMHYYFSIEGTKYIAKEISIMAMELRSRVFQKLQFLHFGYLDKQKAGRLLSKYAFDTQKVEMAMLPILSQLFPVAVHTVATMLILAILDWKLLLIVLFILPIFAFARRFYFGRMKVQNHEARIAQEHLTGRANEYISAIRLIRGYGEESQTTDSLDDTSERYARSRTNQMTINSEFGTFSFVATSLLSLAVVAGGGILALNGQMSLGTLFAFISAMPVLIQPIQLFTQVSQQYFQGKEGYISIRELLDSRYVEVWAGTRILPKMRGNISFDRVTFAYEGQHEPALKEFTLHIPAGQHVALVGPSGSGKSTVANLILGLYHPSGGRILIDDCPQEQLDMRWLRRRCAIVMQESLLLSGSIMDNLRFAKNDASDEEVLEAARLANADQFIRDLPEGYQTKVGERGVSLSGGQRQRISIARAILRDPRLLILDEATSALDYESERLIQEALDNLSRGRTVVTIAHRLSTVKKADRIAVLDKGRIVEQGSFDELADSGGYFQALLSAQG